MICDNNVQPAIKTVIHAINDYLITVNNVAKKAENDYKYMASP